MYTEAGEVHPCKAMREDATFQILAKRLTDIRLWGVVVALAMGGLLKWVRATVVYSKNPC